MDNTFPIYLRAHTVALKPRRASQHTFQKQRQPKWPKHVLIIDCETTTDFAQDLTFGCPRFCELQPDSGYQCVQEVIFHADDLALTDASGLKKLNAYGAQHKQDVATANHNLKILSRSEFIKEYFWPTLLDLQGMIVCFNAPFDLSRLAVDCRESRHGSKGWSFVMSEDIDPATARRREDPFRPRVKITPKDSKSAFIRLTGVGIRGKSGRRLKAYTPGRFLDLKTPGWALRNESFTLKSACEHFKVEGKLDYEPTGKISFKEIDYCRQDVRATNALLNALRNEFNLHPIATNPDEVYSPASFAKAYLLAMQLIPPNQKFEIPDWVNGVAMQAYYGGQTECRIRHTDMPVVLTDVMSEYPTVNVLLNLWRFLIAAKLEVEDATADVQRMLASLTPEMIFDKSFWPGLCFFGMVEPNYDILPVRTDYDGRHTNIGVNPFKSESLWYAGPDIVAAALRGGKAPKIIRAIRVVPIGLQKGMRPVHLRQQIKIDPRKQDFFKSVVEERARVKQDTRLSQAERDALVYFLKILANSGSYGLFVELNQRRAKKGQRERIKVFSGDAEFETTSEIVEEPGRWYFPIFGSLITAAGRLMLALIEYSVKKRAGSYLFCDTDSMAIVASEFGGLVACPGGAFRLPDGREAVKALPWKDVAEIQFELDPLHPYDRTLVRESILKIEPENYKDGVQRSIFSNTIAAKRYVIYSKEGSRLKIVSAKAHALGFLHSPKHGFNEDVGAPQWIVEGWQWVLGELHGKRREEPVWFELPAMMRCTVTTREVLKTLQTSQAKVPYPHRVAKPYNFSMIPLLDDVDGCPIDVTDRDRFFLIAPFERDSSRWYDLAYANIHDPHIGKGRAKKYRLGRPDQRLPSEALPQTYGDFFKRYPWHREAKSNGPDGRPSNGLTRGLLKRMPVVARSRGYIGKETDRRWEQGEDISLLESKVIEYRPNETDRLCTDNELQHEIRKVSIRKVAKKAGVSENTVKAARRGERLQRRIIVKLREAAKALAAPNEPQTRN